MSLDLYQYPLSHASIFCIVEFDFREFKFCLIANKQEDIMMRSKNPLNQFLVLLLLCAPFTAYADSWSCRQVNNVREVHIERTTPNPVPCQIVYRKLTEGVEDQVLWSAEFDPNYCDARAREFISKLESFGWVCVETIRDDAGVIVGGDNSEGEGTVDSNTGEDSDAGENATGS